MGGRHLEISKRLPNRSLTGGKAAHRASAPWGGKRCPNSGLKAQVKIIMMHALAYEEHTTKQKHMLWPLC